MKTELELDNNAYQLFRYPPKSQQESLQAWDAADEYLVNYLNNTPEQPQSKILVLNDDFGALGVMLKEKVSQWYSDSKVSELGLLHNWLANYGDKPGCDICNSLDAIKNGLDLAIIKLPKNNQLLIEELITLREVLPSDTLVITAGKAKQIQKSTLSIFEKHLGPTRTSLAVKKARLIFTRVNKALSTSSKFPCSWQSDNSNLIIYNLSNVFSSNQLDIGARALLDHLPDCRNKTVLDLGCGNGVLSAHVAAMVPKKVICVDESLMAVQSARMTIEANFPESSQNFEYYHSNCLEQVQNQNVDIVLCNPPFHQQNAITDHIAWQMFNDAKRSLRQGGELRIVGNRHLGYHDKLRRLFGGYKQVASNQKFVILSSEKR